MTGRQKAHVTEASLATVILVILGGLAIAVREVIYTYGRAPQGGAQ